MPVRCEFEVNKIPYFGSLINWSEDSFFIETELEIKLKELKSEKYIKINFIFNDEKFESECRIVSYNKDLMGFGFVVVKKNPIENAWIELINILEERKIKPRLNYE
jgi:uncharacterized protein YueI